MLPLVARNPAIDRAVSEYVLAQAEHFHEAKIKHDDAIKNGKQSVPPPIPLRDSDALHRFADLVLYEELRWSHPDKMSIVDYPIMSDRQAERFAEDHTLIDEVMYGDRIGDNRRVTYFTDDSGTPQTRKTLLPNKDDTSILETELSVDINSLIDRAKLSKKQREAIDLIFYGKMTYDEASAALGIRKSTLAERVTTALRKLRRAAGIYEDIPEQNAA